MVKTFKTPAAKRLLSLLFVLVLLVSLAFSSSVSLAAEPEADGHTHVLTIRAEEVLAAIESGETPLGDSAGGTTTIGESSKPVVSPAPGESPAPGTSTPPVGDSIPAVGSSELPGSSAVPGSSTQPVSTPETTKAPSMIDKIDIPFGSTTLKADLLEHLKANLPVRFFDHNDIGCTSCQALVTVNPATKRLSIIAINGSENETHTFKLNIIDENNSPLRLQDVTREAISAEKKVFDGDIKDAKIPAGTEVEILEVVTGSESTAASSALPASSAAGGSSSSISSDISVENSSIAPKPTEGLLAVFRSFNTAAAGENTGSGTSSSDTSHENASPDTSSEGASSDVSSEASSSAESSYSSQAASSGSGSQTGSSSGSFGTSSADDNQNQDKVLKTVALLIQSETVSLGVQAFEGSTMEVKSGFTTLDAATMTEPALNSIHVSKQASMVSESDRTYQVTLNAWADKVPVAPVDIVLVLDASGSMPWLTTEPSVQRTVSQLPKSAEHAYDQYDFSYYKYYVEVDNEYRPIEYLTTTPAGYSGSIQDTGVGWYRIESNSDGRKAIKGIVATSAVIYEKGATDKTKLEMLQTSANNFVNSVAAVSPNSKIGVVAFNATATKLCSMTSMNTAGAGSVNSKINSIHLTGNTRHDLAMTAASELLTTVRQDTCAKYVVLFTDGQPVGADENTVITNTVNTSSSLKSSGVTIFSIGLYGGNVSISKLEKFLKDVASSNAHYYNASNSGLDNVFNTIFSGIAQGITGAKVVDVVNERFTLTTGSKNALSAAGATVGTDSAGRDVITWNNQTIPCTGDAATGWKKSFTIQAKANYVGGNQVPTNSDGSQLTHPDKSSFIRTFTSPLVDVPLRYSIAAKDGYFYIGDEVGNSARLAGLRAPASPDWFTHDDTTITYSLAGSGGAPLTGRLTADTVYTLKALVTPVNSGDYAAKSFSSPAPQKTLYMLSPAVTLTDETIFSGEQTNLNERVSPYKPADTPVWQYKINANSYGNKKSEWVYAGSGSTDAPPALAYSYKYHATGAPVATPAVLALFEKTDFDILANRAGVPETFNLNPYVRYTNTSKTPQAQGSSGWFTINVELGSITVNKQINENWAPHGDPIFVYKLERLNAAGGVEQTYSDFIRFTGGATGAQSFKFEGLPAGIYRLTELDTLRYHLQSINAPNASSINVSAGCVDFSLSSRNRRLSASFVNTKVEDRWFSHTDVVKNTFKIGKWSTPKIK